MKINQSLKNKGINMSICEDRKAYEYLDLKFIIIKTKIKENKEIKNTIVKDVNILMVILNLKNLININLPMFPISNQNLNSIIYQ